MRISKKCRHGVRVMLTLAALPAAKTLTLRELAATESASEKYLWQVMNALTSAGLVRAARGAQGGYRLAHASRAITLKDIVFALDGPCKLVAHSRMNNSSRSEERVESEIWADMERKISTYLASSTLRDLRERCDRQNQMPDYVI
ncbi:MAG: Rrf2 family transcriptional regulator [Kiritimatiellae bacterium]|jgi:Rrf2 family protein|nr:Rrf2 family transcriptional regulator [Kiritimatiellia bacterium]NLD89042.1 Rrf2 family transcriptional regulator [Lentisphaerota bacterium]HOU20815.1 Rrf2 family transcriptional regulator [Kiritimatiellia bacterium]HPC19712.1 Rrf2 family transcriptional regulator [Kiritimatiellia bacterium]